jgi:hypothetical protein
MSQPKDYDSTIARMAGNIIGCLMAYPADSKSDFLARERSAVAIAVRLSRAIVAEVKRTEPEKA